MLSTNLSKLKDFLRAQSVTYTVNGVIGDISETVQGIPHNTAI